MGGGQPLGDLPADLQDLRRLQRACPIEPLLERFAGDELHHQVRQRLLLDRVHLDDVLVPNLGRRPGLAQKPFAGGRGGGDLRAQHLDRDHALQRLVEGAEHDAEAALAEDFEHLVMSDAAEGIGPGGRLQEIEGAVLVVARSFAFGSRQVAPHGGRLRRRSPAWHPTGSGAAASGSPTGLLRKSPTLAWAFNSLSTWRRSSASPAQAESRKAIRSAAVGFVQGREQQGFHSRGLAHDRTPRRGSMSIVRRKSPKPLKPPRDFFQNYSWWSSSVSSA